MNQNNKKVSIITLHHVTNFGSLLQTYALQSYITELGWNVEFVDFIPYGLSMRAALFPKKNDRTMLKRIIRFFPYLICNVIEMSDMSRFLKKHIHLSKKRYTEYRELKEDAPIADIYMNGSDQVWNVQNNNAPDDIQAYLLNYAPQGANRISYAGSFGRKEIMESERKVFIESFSKYNAISVRESSAKSIMEGLGFTSAVHVIDPTLLLTWDKWKILSSHLSLKKPYILVYNLNRNKEIKVTAIKLSKRTGLRVVNFADTFDLIQGANNRIHNKPEDFLYLFMNAEYILTDSFHGTAFSINFNKQFMTFCAPNYNSRIESILELFGLKDRLVTDSFSIDCFMIPIDWNEVNRVLAAERQKADIFLKKGLE